MRDFTIYIDTNILLIKPSLSFSAPKTIVLLKTKFASNLKNKANFNFTDVLLGHLM